MEYKTAILYVEAILFARGEIERTLKKLQPNIRANFPRPDANFVAGPQKIAPDIIRCISNRGEAFPVASPRKWLDVIDNALIIYRQEYGDSQYLTIYHRYAKKYNVTQITAYEGISKRLYQSRRVEFLSILVSLAVQEGLLKVSCESI